mmetsp:Transcript_37276/g.79165  ORF Transcript_37276/g.79165 Transcript_37276/m.79165 type:complete len:284 (-) Transcript_37276:284-1135(-)
MSKEHLCIVSRNELVDGRPNADTATSFVQVAAAGHHPAGRQQGPPKIEVARHRLLSVVRIDIDERRRPRRLASLLVDLSEGVGEVSHQDVAALKRDQPVPQVLKDHLVIPVGEVVGVVISPPDVDEGIHHVHALRGLPVLKEAHGEVPAADPKDHTQATGLPSLQEAPEVLAASEHRRIGRYLICPAAGTHACHYSRWRHCRRRHCRRSHRRWRHRRRRPCRWRHCRRRHRGTLLALPELLEQRAGRRHAAGSGKSLLLLLRLDLNPVQLAQELIRRKAPRRR